MSVAGEVTESFLSRVLNGGMKSAFNSETLQAAETYHQNVFKNTIKSSGIGEALFGSKGKGGLVKDFMEFANGGGIAPVAGAEALMARKIGAYGGAAVLGGGAAMGAYALGTKGISTAGDIAQSHPGAVALAAGTGIWAATAGKGMTQGMLSKASKYAAAGMNHLSGLGKK